MAHDNTGFHTLVRILPRHEIDRLDRKYGQGDRRRKTSRYVQFIVMLMAQILGLKSLVRLSRLRKASKKGFTISASSPPSVVPPFLV
jgi:putative transposase